MAPEERERKKQKDQKIRKGREMRRDVSSTILPFLIF